MYISILVLLVSLMSSCSKTEQKNVSNSDGKCAAINLCDEYENNYRVCTKNIYANECKQFLDNFKALAADKSCTTKNGQKKMTALTKCDEGRDYQQQVRIRAMMTLNELLVISSESRNYFASDDFRSLLSGESSEAFKNKSVALKKYNEKQLLSSSDLFTEENRKKLSLYVNEQLLPENAWILLFSYLIHEEVGDDIKPQQIPNYDQIANTIVNERDSFLIKLYMDFILRSQNSADEIRSYGLARIYDSLPMKFLKILSSYNKDQKEALIKSSTWGIANLKHPLGKDISLDELKKIIPSDISVYEDSYKYKDLAEKLAKSVHVISINE